MEERLRDLKDAVAQISSPSRDLSKRANDQSTELMRAIDKTLKDMEAMARAGGPSQRRAMVEEIDGVRGGFREESGGGEKSCPASSCKWHWSG